MLLVFILIIFLHLSISKKFFLKYILNMGTFRRNKSSYSM